MDLPPLDVDLCRIMDTDSQGEVRISHELEVASHYDHLSHVHAKALHILGSQTDPTKALFDLGVLCDSLRSRHRFLGLNSSKASL